MRLKLTEPSILSWITVYPPPAVVWSQYTLKAPKSSGSNTADPSTGFVQLSTVEDKIKVFDGVGMSQTRGGYGFAPDEECLKLLLFYLIYRIKLNDMNRKVY